MNPAWLVFIVIYFSLFSCCGTEIYYIFQGTVANKTCSVNNGTSLSPCYSLQQLCEDKSELLINKSAVTLILLSGRHVLPENYTLTLSDINEVEISPWNLQEVIECHAQTGILFHNIRELDVLSLNFTSCTILLNSTGLPFKGNVVISDCAFIRSDDYAIAIVKDFNTHKKFNISIISGVFLSNNGILSSDYGLLYFANYNKVILFIINSLFMSNWRSDDLGTLYLENVHLTLHESSFVNNTNGAVRVVDSFMLITNTSFLDNHDNRKGGAINHQSSYVEIYGCVFSNNSADYSGGAIESFSTEQFILSDSKFFNNFANVTGGALHIATVKIYNSEFENNYAAQSGGALSFFVGDSAKLKDSHIIITTFNFNEARVDGGAIYSDNKNIIDIGVDILIHGGNSENNSAINGGFLNIQSGSVSISGHSNYH